VQIPLPIQIDWIRLVLVKKLQTSQSKKRKAALSFARILQSGPFRSCKISGDRQRFSNPSSITSLAKKKSNSITA
jgi:hypothetical protein